MGRGWVAAWAASVSVLLATAGARALPTVALPEAADAPMEIVAPEAEMSIRVRLVEASPARAVSSPEETVYRAAVGDADLIRRKLDGGVEDLVRFPTRPGRESVTYAVDLQGIAGVRLFENAVEFLDADDGPGLRMAPPSIIDADGVEHDAEVRVKGCAYSTDPDPDGPGDHPIPPLGASSCIIEVHWSIQHYPAELDPAWTVTAAMNVPRSDFALHILSTAETPKKIDRVLALGGIRNIEKGLVTKTVEIYGPCGHGKGPHCWRLRRPMSSRRAHFTVIGLKETGKVLIAGGCTDESHATCTPNTATEIYNRAHGGKSTPNAMVSPHEWSETKIVTDADGNERLMVLGGSSLVVDLYAPEENEWEDDHPAVPWAHSLVEFAAASFSDFSTGTKRTDLLVCGGKQDGVATRQCWTWKDGAWSAGPTMQVKRYGHTATSVTVDSHLPDAGEHSNNGVVFVGGDVESDASDAQPPIGTAELFVNGEFKSKTTLASARRYHAAGIRDNGVLIVSGGDSDGLGTASATAEGLGQPYDGEWFSRDSMNYPRAHHAMTSWLEAHLHPILVAGGRTHEALETAELIAPLPDGESCTNDGQCQSGTCKKNAMSGNVGVCCGCNAICERCEDGCMPAEEDDDCPGSNDPAHCGRLHRCQGRGCESNPCGPLLACREGVCAVNCESDKDCISGAVCRAGACFCLTSAVCKTGQVCSANGKCVLPFGQADEQVSCELSDAGAGVGASLLVFAGALAARRRRQKGTATKACGDQITKGS